MQVELLSKHQPTQSKKMSYYLKESRVEETQFDRRESILVRANGPAKAVLLGG